MITKLDWKVMIAGGGNSYSSSVYGIITLPLTEVITASDVHVVRWIFTCIKWNGVYRFTFPCQCHNFILKRVTYWVELAEPSTAWGFGQHLGCWRWLCMVAWRWKASNLSWSSLLPREELSWSSPKSRNILPTVNEYVKSTRVAQLRSCWIRTPRYLLVLTAASPLHGMCRHPQDLHVFCFW